MNKRINQTVINWLITIRIMNKYSLIAMQLNCQSKRKMILNKRCLTRMQLGLLRMNKKQSSVQIKILPWRKDNKDSKIFNKSLYNKTAAKVAE